MKIVTDKRIELMAVVQTMCNYWDDLMMRFNNGHLYSNEFKENAKSYFDKHKEHKVIKLYKALCNDIADISFFLNLSLCYSPPPELISIANYEDNFGKINSTVFPHEDFINELRNFYTDTNFEKFYEDNQNEYYQMLKDYGNKTDLSVNTVLEYLNNDMENYTVIISPFLMGGFGIKLNTYTNGALQYSIMSPYDYKENKYIFGSATGNS